MSDEQDPKPKPDASTDAPPKGVEALLKSLFPQGPSGGGLSQVDGPSDESLAGLSLDELDALDDDELLGDEDLDALIADGLEQAVKAHGASARRADSTAPNESGGESGDEGGDEGDEPEGAPAPGGGANALLAAIFGGDGGGDLMAPEPEDESADAEAEDPAGARSMLQWMLDHSQLELEPGAELDALALAFAPILSPLLGSPDGASEAADWLADRPEVAELFISDEHLQALMDQW